MAFTDTSTGPITSWDWTFGDGVTSTSQSPSHSYSNSGTYTVSLTVTGPGGSDTATKDVRVGGNVTIEVGEVTITHEWQRVDFQSEFLDPVVIVGSTEWKRG